jgi:hypothetical protein
MKTVTEMAREAGISDCTCSGTRGCLERFAELIRADEREACAKVARLFYNPKDGMLPFKKSTESNKNLLALEIEEAIKARGQA